MIILWEAFGSTLLGLFMFQFCSVCDFGALILSILNVALSGVEGVDVTKRRYIFFSVAKCFQFFQWLINL